MGSQNINSPYFPDVPGARAFLVRVSCRLWGHGHSHRPHVESLWSSQPEEGGDTCFREAKEWAGCWVSSPCQPHMPRALWVRGADSAVSTCGEPAGLRGRAALPECRCGGAPVLCGAAGGRGNSAGPRVQGICRGIFHRFLSRGVFVEAWSIASAFRGLTS